VCAVGKYLLLRKGEESAMQERRNTPISPTAIKISKPPNDCPPERPPQRTKPAVRKKTWEVSVQRAIVKKNFIGTTENQLALREGWQISVIAMNEDGWWSGSYRGQLGMFPAECVELVVPLPDDHSTTPTSKVQPPPLPPICEIAESQVQKMGKRENILREILTTEEAYINDLTTMKNVFLFPLKTTQIIKDEMITIIFGNVETIITINTDFYNDLSKRLTEHFKESKMTVHIGDLFANLADYLKIYTSYISNLMVAGKTVKKLKAEDKNFARFLKICESDPCVGGHTLKDFLITPVQRICRYPLLLKELIKSTPEDHTDYQDLVAAKTKLDSLVAKIEEARSDSEETENILQIAECTENLSNLVIPARKFVSEEIMSLYSVDRKQKLHTVCFL